MTILLFILFSCIYCIDGYGSLKNENGNKSAISILSKRAICLKPGEEFILKANLGERFVGIDKIDWISTDPGIVSLDSKTDSSVQIKALKLGQCNIKIFADRRQIASCRIIVDNDGIIKILAIGNSFSEDALEGYLFDIMNGEGINVVIGNMYIAGCSLERHWNNALEDRSEYNYRKIVNGIKKERENVRLSQAIVDEDWDYISFQQASHFSGMYTTFEMYLPLLVEYVKGKNDNRNTQYVLHQTWSYANNSTHDGFMNYNNDQRKMYKDIVTSISKSANLAGIEIVVPVGTAVQNGRTSFIGDNFCRDGYHLDYQIGRYTASCTWAAELFGLNITSSHFIPTSLTLEEILVARFSAYYAIKNPNEITTLAY